MRCTVRPLNGENSKRVKEILSSKTDIYGDYEDVGLINTQFFQVTNENNDLVGFFGLSYWEFEVVVSCIYVEKEWRRHGILKKMLKFAIKTAPKDCWLTLNASNKNVTANRIYARLLEYMYFDEKENVHWYLVRKIKKRGGN